MGKKLANIAKGNSFWWCVFDVNEFSWINMKGGLCWWHCVPLTCHVKKGKKVTERQLVTGPSHWARHPFTSCLMEGKQGCEENYGKSSLCLTCQPLLSPYSTNTLSLCLWRFSVTLALSNTETSHRWRWGDFLSQLNMSCMFSGWMTPTQTRVSELIACVFVHFKRGV